MTMTVAEALESFYETRADAGHAFIPSGLPPSLCFLLTANLFELEFQFYTCRLAGSARSRPYADRHRLRFDDPDTAQWN
jgi:hypothetical protein